MADDATAVADEKLEQTVTLEDAGPAQKKITIEIPESRIKEKIEDSYGSLRDDAVLPGFAHTSVVDAIAQSIGSPNPAQSKVMSTQTSL